MAQDLVLPAQAPDLLLGAPRRPGCPGVTRAGPRLDLPAPVAQHVGPNAEFPGDLGLRPAALFGQAHCLNLELPGEAPSPFPHRPPPPWLSQGNRGVHETGARSKYAYDARNAPTLVTAPDGSETAYAHDDLGRLVSLTDANGRVTTYGYDAAGRLLSQTGPLGDVTAATYDARGQLATRTDPRGQQIEYRYDAAGRLVEKRLPDGTSEQHVYDSTGRLTSAASATITYTFGYDSAGRLTSVTDSRGYVVGYGYDVSGRRTSLTYPGGQVLTYGYDAAGRPALLSESSGRTAAFTYDTLGRRSRLDLPNGTRVLYTYDGGSRLVGLTHETSAGATLDQFTYAYNTAGERTSEADLAATRAYAYDLVGRLTEVVETPAGSSQGQVVEAYTYDAVGNRLTGPGAADDSTYNAGHQLLAGPAASYTYDANGNRTVRSSGAGTTTYTWDPQDRLVQVSIAPAQGAWTTVTFAYDHRGRRVRKTVSQTGSVPVVTDYVYDEDDVILIVETPQTPGATPTVTRVVHGPDVDEPLWLDQNGQLHVLHADALGSVRLVTDAAQAIVERTDYTSFGAPTRTGTGVRHPFAFTGREWDGEIGLYYYRARYYDPEVGRFLSRDPLGLAAGPNLYAYVENSPTNYLDPSGQIVSSVVCPNKRPWDDSCFVYHYYHGFGRTVDMVEVGLLPALRAARGTKDALQATQARIRAEAARHAKKLCDDCDKGTKRFTFGTDRRGFERNFTEEPGLFVYGKGSLYTGSTCSGTANCASRTCSFDCEISFDVPDEFSDPFSFRERSGTAVEVGLPYNLKARWIERWAGGGGF